jgi:hypothetical protein
MSIRARHPVAVIALAFILGAWVGFGLGKHRHPAADPRDFRDPHDRAAALHAHGLHLRYVPDGTQGAAFLTLTEATRAELLALPRAPGPAWKGTVHASRPALWDEAAAGGERVGRLLLRGDPALAREIAEALR